MPESRLIRPPFTVDDVRFILSSPAYAYGINLQPAERVAEAVMDLNSRLAHLTCYDPAVLVHSISPTTWPIEDTCA
jgi:hypothetical protein